ncbi:MAG: hypothetical protein RIS70_2363 [Planctomycetota bacterium]|jgi:hypothetical protein
MTHPIHAVLTEHSPRPAGDPLYVPYWAKGDYARRLGTRYTTEEGSVIEAGRVVKEGLGKASEGRSVCISRGTQENATETPRKASETRSRQARSLDLASTLVKSCASPDEKCALAIRHGIDPAAVKTAPNPGVASMRLVNALRKVLDGQP